MDLGKKREALSWKRPFCFCTAFPSCLDVGYVWSLFPVLKSSCDCGPGGALWWGLLPGDLSFRGVWTEPLWQGVESEDGYPVLPCHAEVGKQQRSNLNVY